MSKKTKYILIGVGAIILISLLSNIGGGDDAATQEVKEVKEVVLKAAQTEIKGDLKGCYEVVDKDYKVKFATKSYEDDLVTVELKRTSKNLPYDRKDVTIFPGAEKSSANNCAGFGIEILNADGDVIDKKTANATPYSWDEMTAALQLLQDETTTIRFYFDNLSEATSFRVTSLVQNNDKRKDALEETAKEAAKSAKEASKKAKDADDDYEKSLKMAEKSLKAAGKILEMEEDLLDMMDDLDDLDW